MKPGKALKPKQFYFVMLGGLAAIVLAGSFAYFQAAKVLENRAGLLRKSLADIQLSKERIDHLQLLSKDYNSILPLVPTIEKAVPKTKKQSEIVLQVKQIATESGMSVSGFTFPASGKLPAATSQTVAAGGMLGMPLDFQLSGNYSQIQPFLQKLENLDRYTQVTTLSISKAEGRNVTYNITLNALLQP